MKSRWTIFLMAGLLLVAGTAFAGKRLKLKRSGKAKARVATVQPLMPKGEYIVVPFQYEPLLDRVLRKSRPGRYDVEDGRLILTGCFIGKNDTHSTSLDKISAAITTPALPVSPGGAPESSPAAAPAPASSSVPERKAEMTPGGNSPLPPPPSSAPPPAGSPPLAGH